MTPIERKWMAIAMQCDICGVSWAAVAPVGAIEAQCPQCGHFCSIPGCWDAIEQTRESESSGDGGLEGGDA